MSSTTINLDYAYNLILTLRRAGFYIRTFTVLLDSAAFDFSNGYVELIVFRDRECRSEVISKNSDDDPTYISITGNVITTYFFADLTDLNPQKYFWVLRYVDQNGKYHYWLAGDYEVYTGKPKGDADSSNYTISIPDALGSITLSLSSASAKVWYPPEDLTGTKNGVNKTFTLPEDYIDGEEVIIQDGVVLERNDTIDGYTRSGTTITMVIAPESTTKLKSFGNVLT